MSKCYRCCVQLAATNSTYEHIISNACGGRLKSKVLLCKSCNSFFGNTFDKELANLTNDLVNLLCIKREKGRAQPIKAKVKSTGIEYYFHSNDKIERVKPTIIQTKDGENIELSIQAPNMKMLKQILEGYKRKHLELDIEAAYSKATNSHERLQEAVNIKMIIGGDGAFKAMAKTAISYFIYNGGGRQYITSLLPYLNSEYELDIVWMHYPEELIYIPNDREVSHVIKLVGNPEERILYAYIELFNCHKYLVKLNDNYTGVAINETYIFDLIERAILNREINLSYNRVQLLDFFINKNYKPFDKVQKAVHRVVHLAQVFQRERQLERIIYEAWDNSLGKYPVGTVVTEEMAGEFRRLYFDSVTHFLNPKKPSIRI